MPSRPLQDCLGVAALMPCIEIRDRRVPATDPVQENQCGITVAHDRLSEHLDTVIKVLVILQASEQWLFVLVVFFVGHLAQDVLSVGSVSFGR